MVLDIGTGSVKTLVCEKEEGKINVLAGFLEYFEELALSGAEGAWDFNLRAKSIKSAISKIFENFGKKKIPRKIILGLPADILKARIVSQTINRKNAKRVIDSKERVQIEKEVQKEVQKKISEKFSREAGILPQDIEFLKLKILETKIDGYQVSNINGYEGEILEFRVLGVFSTKHYLNCLKNIFKELKLKVVDFVHEGEGLLYYIDNEKKSGIFLDIGAEVTQIFLAPAGKIEEIYEFNSGAMNFCRTLSLDLGMKLSDAMVFQERYSKGLLGEEVRKKTKEIFSQDARNWFENFKKTIKSNSQFAKAKLLPRNIFVFGGGGYLLELQEILREGNLEDAGFLREPEVKLLEPKDLKNIEDKTRKLNSLQDTPTLLMTYVHN